MDIKRYDAEQTVDVGGYTFIDIVEDKDGDLVYHSDHLQAVKELKDKLESMKCCDNCGHYNNKVKDFCNLTQYGIYDPSTAKCNNWQPKEKD